MLNAKKIGKPVKRGYMVSTGRCTIVRLAKFFGLNFTTHIVNINSIQFGSVRP